MKKRWYFICHKQLLKSVRALEMFFFKKKKKLNWSRMSFQSNLRLLNIKKTCENRFCKRISVIKFSILKNAQWGKESWNKPGVWVFVCVCPLPRGTSCTGAANIWKEMPPINKREGTSWRTRCIKHQSVVLEKKQVFSEDVFKLNICVCFVIAFEIRAAFPFVLEIKNNN